MVGNRPAWWSQTHMTPSATASFVALLPSVAFHIAHFIQFHQPLFLSGPQSHFPHIYSLGMPVNTALLKGLFNSVMYGADKIPDSWFHKVPGGYFRPPKDDDDKKKKKKHRSRRYSDADRGYDDEDEEDDGYASDQHNDRRGRRNHVDEYDDDHYKERGYGGRARGQSLGAARGFDGAQYEPPPMGAPYSGTRAYNPTEFAPARAADRDDPYFGRQQDMGNDGTRFVAVSIHLDSTPWLSSNILNSPLQVV